MVLSPSSVVFDDTTGNPSALPKTVTIARGDTASAPLTGLALGNITYSGTPGWLTATISGPDAPATLTLSESKVSLTPGTYTASLPITSRVATNSPQNVVVTLKLVSRPPPPPPPPPPGATITIVAAGNLGRCGGDLATESAKAIAAVNPDYVFVLGNNVTPATGRVTTLEDYLNCYEPVWGQFKSKTYAALGDKEVDLDTIAPYGSGMAAGADAYFGPERVGPPGKNYYSMDLGSWHFVVLNVQSGGPKRPLAIRYNANSEQLDWLNRDLRDHPNKCTIALWNLSMWMSSTKIYETNDRYPNHGYRVQDIRGVWTVLYQRNADLVINGTPHIYERFAPMRYAEGYSNPTTTEYAADSARGIRQITSGLGGDGPIVADSALVKHPLSEYRSGGDGFVKLVLGDGAYTWQFVNSRYSHIIDQGSGTCH